MRSASLNGRDYVIKACSARGGVSMPTNTGIPQRGAASSRGKKPLKNREGERRVTLALDARTYRRLRMHAANTDQTHQTILESALAEYLKHASS